VLVKIYSHEKKLGTNTLDNTNLAQTWNWSTLTNQTALALNANSITTGTLLALSSSAGATGANLLTILNGTTGLSLKGDGQLVQNGTSTFATTTASVFGVGTSTNIYGGTLTLGATLNNALVLASSTALSTSTYALYNVNGALYWNGSALGGGSASGAAGAIQLSNGAGAFTSTTTFAYSTSTNMLTFGPLAETIRIFSTTTDASTGNLFMGNAAGNTSTTASGLTGFGRLVLSANTSGSYNTAFGDSALQNNTTGTNNVAVGAYVLNLNTIGTYNTGVGSSALTNLTSGSTNVGLGTNALSALATGTSNIAIGVSAGSTLVSGDNNIFIGAAGASTNATNTLNIGGAFFASNLATSTTIITGFGIGTSTSIYGGDLTPGLTLGATTIAGNQIANVLQLAAATSTAFVSTSTYALYNVNGSLYWNGSALGTGGTSFGAAGTVQLSNGSGGFTSTSTFSYSTSTSVLTIGSSASAISIFSTSTGGSQNLFIGQSTGNLTTTNSQNLAIGSSALNAVTSGGTNSAIGITALQFNTTGLANSALGFASLNQNTTGSNNTAVGMRAMNQNTTGSNNAALGLQSLQRNSSATNTVAVGANAARGTAAYSNQGGVYLGSSAGTNVITGSDYNTFIGFQSGINNTSGSYNILLGAATSSLGGITTGSENILIGNGSAFGLSQTGSNQLNIGNLIFGSGVQGSTTLATGGVGIGTSTNIYGGSLTKGLTLNNALVLASSTAISTTTFALYNNNGTLYWNGSALGGASPWISGNGSTTLTTITDLIGIGTTSPSATLALVGNLFASSTATSTFYGGGINLVTSSGNIPCFAVNGTCLTNNSTYQWSTTTNSMIYYSAGNVGIGTTSSYYDAKLTVSIPVTQTFTTPSLIAGADAGGSLTGTMSLGAQAIEVQGNYAYVLFNGNTGACSATAGNTNGCEFKIFDISSTTNPVYKGGGDIIGTTNSGTTGVQAFIDIKVYGSFAYITTNTPGTTNCSSAAYNFCGVQIWNISDPTAPALVSAISTAGNSGFGASLGSTVSDAPTGIELSADGKWLYVVTSGKKW
jgi:hypothetical protein